jgi:AmpD protein
VPFREFIQLSPNRDPAPPNEQLGVVFHHSVISFDETVALMMQPASKASYHVLIALDGTRCALVPDEEIAWHAGASAFLGRSRCNDFTLGASFAGDTYAAPLTEHQIASAVEWLAPRWARYGWTTASVTDHRQVSPGRKDDLNPVEWTRLLAAITVKFAQT